MKTRTKQKAEVIDLSTLAPGSVIEYTGVPPIIQCPPSNGIVEFNQFEADLVAYTQQYENVVYDLTVKSIEKQARSDRHTIGTKIAELDRAHAAVKAPLKAQVDLLDGERKRIKDALKAIQDRIKSQIEAHEAGLKAIEDALIAKVEHIQNFGVFSLPISSNDVFDRLLEVGDIVVDDSYAHYRAKAEQSLASVQDSLNRLFAETTPEQDMSIMQAESLAAVTQDLGLLQIAYDDRATLLESCEKALIERDNRIAALEADKLAQQERDAKYCNTISGLQDYIVALESRIHEACEIYTGMDGFVAETCPEGYQQMILKQMHDALLKEQGE